MRANRYLRFSAIASSLVPLAIACSDLEPSGGDAPDATPPAQIPGDSGGAEVDAGSDAASDDDAAPPKRTCSDDGFCHTVVPAAQTLRAVWGDGAGVVWTVTEQGNILRWDGATWIQSHSEGVPLYAVWGSGPTDLWAGGGARTSGNTVLPGVLLHGTGPSPDAITWTSVAAPVTVRSIWGTSATDVWATASLTHRVRATDPSFVLHYAGPPADPGAGTGWEVDPVSGAFPGHFEKVWGTSRDDVWLAGRVAITSSSSQGQVLHRMPDGAGGFAWAKSQPAITGNAPVDVHGFSASRSAAFLVGFSGDYKSPWFHTGVSSDDGASFTWTEHQAAETGFSESSLSTLWATSPSDVWIAGQRGRLRHWDGTSWRVAAVALDDVMPVQKAVYAFWGRGTGDFWVVGADLAIYRVAPWKE